MWQLTLDHWLTPADLKGAVVEMEQTLALFKLPDNWNEIAKFYVEVIEDIPADLLVDALKHVRMTKKWFPKPSELREGIASEMAERQLLAARLRIMAGKFNQTATTRPLMGGTQAGT